MTHVHYVINILILDARDLHVMFSCVMCSKFSYKSAACIKPHQSVCKEDDAGKRAYQIGLIILRGSEGQEPCPWSDYARRRRS